MPATLHVPDDAKSIILGHAITWFIPTATDGDNFENLSGHVQCLVRNESAIAVNVTIDCPVACNRGYFHDVEKEVAAGESWISTVLAAGVFADPSTHNTLVICDSITDVKMAFIDSTFSPTA
jgi:hypothetical protein